MKILAESIATAVIEAHVQMVNLTEWLFNLQDTEYPACSKDHIAGGISVSQSGKRMSINVERIAGNLLNQHYVEEIGAKDHCRVILFQIPSHQWAIQNLAIFEVASSSNRGCVGNRK